MSSSADSDHVPSGFHHPSKRRAGGLSRKSEDGTTSAAASAEMIGRVFADRNQRAQALADAVPAMRKTKPTTSQTRREAIPPKPRRGNSAVRAMPPTLERFEKGPIAAPPRGVEAPYRAISASEQLRDQRDLRAPRSRLTPDQLKQLHEKGKLDHDHRTSEGMYEAALRLRRHYEGSMIGTLKAQDLNRVIGIESSDDTVEEAWVHHRECFLTACKLMGWSDLNRLRGSARLIVAVVCEDMTVREAARIHVGRGDTTALMGAAMDRLREGLFTLAVHWRFV